MLVALTHLTVMLNPAQLIGGTESVSGPSGPVLTCHPASIPWDDELDAPTLLSLSGCWDTDAREQLDTHSMATSTALLSWLLWVRPGWSRDWGTKRLAGTSKIILQREKKIGRKLRKGGRARHCWLPVWRLAEAGRPHSWVRLQVHQ